MSDRVTEAAGVGRRRQTGTAGGPRKPLTIRDVAALAGVSQGTVSKALNDAPGVGAETRARILKVIEDLDYHPDASARSLVARKTGSIGVIIPHTGSYSMASAYWPSPPDRDHRRPRRPRASTCCSPPRARRRTSIRPTSPS